jgi:hypothetical protein
MLTMTPHNGRQSNGEKYQVCLYGRVALHDNALGSRLSANYRRAARACDVFHQKRNGHGHINHFRRGNLNGALTTCVTVTVSLAAGLVFRGRPAVYPGTAGHLLYGHATGEVLMHEQGKLMTLRGGDPPHGRFNAGQLTGLGGRFGFGYR